MLAPFRLYNGERLMRWRGELDHDRIGWLHDTTSDDNGHDAGFAHEIAGLVTGEDRRREPILKPVQLDTRVPKPGDLDNCVRAKPQPGAARKRQQLESLGSHVLSEIARRDVETRCTEFFEKLTMNEVHLAQVRLGRIARHSRPMPNRGAGVCVALDTEAFYQPDERPR